MGMMRANHPHRVTRQPPRPPRRPPPLPLPNSPNRGPASPTPEPIRAVLMPLTSSETAPQTDEACHPFALTFSKEARKRGIQENVKRTSRPWAGNLLASLLPGFLMSPWSCRQLKGRHQGTASQPEDNPMPLKSCLICTRFGYGSSSGVSGMQ